MAEAQLGSQAGKCAAILGLACKPGTGDVREAPSLKVISELLQRGTSMKVFDPVAEKNARSILGDTIEMAATADEAIEGADVIFIITEWDVLKNPQHYCGKKVFDGRRVLEPQETDRIDYEGMGVVIKCAFY